MSLVVFDLTSRQRFVYDGEGRVVALVSRSEVISYFYGYKERPHLVSHAHFSLGDVAYKLFYDDRDRQML